jgi:hypothetical protein
VSQLDRACNIPEPNAITKFVAQQQHKPRIFLVHNSCWLFLSLLATLFLAPLPVLARLYTGSVTGVVTDSSGSTIPAAQITLVDQAKGYSFTATTDNSGRYLLRSIPPGTYNITAEAPNFQKETQEGVKVDVSQNISVDLSSALERKPFA